MNKIIIDPQPPSEAINFFYDGDDQLRRYVWKYQIKMEVGAGFQFDIFKQGPDKKQYNITFNQTHIWGDCPHGEGYDAEFIDGKWYWVKTDGKN